MTLSSADFHPVIGDGLLGVLGLALAGGLILNLMPCVLPVLSLKLLAVVSKGGRSRRDVRLGFLASSAGILFTFLALAGAMITAKAVGVAAGWGVQFQHPLFLIAVALLCVLFAGNLWDLFEVRLPARIAGEIVRRDGAHGLAGDFFSGVFATVLATPCSAPLLGTAIGFALAGGPIEILAVFAALGTGLALPYLLVALFPGLAASSASPWSGRLPGWSAFSLSKQEVLPHYRLAHASAWS